MKRIKTNFGPQIIILAIALLIALPVRVYQYLNLIDGQTGFFNTWTNPAVFGLYGLCVLFIILILALSNKGSKKAVYALPKTKSTSLGISALVFALSVAVQACYSAYRAFGILNGTILVDQLIIGDNVGKPTLTFLILEAVFGILAAAYLIAFGVGYISGKMQHKKLRVLAVAPVLWGVARLMICFTQTISYRYVSELMFELFMIVFFCMFFVAFAKFSENLLESRVQTRLFAYGMISVFFGLLLSVPRYIVVLMGRYDVLYKQSSVFNFCDLIMPVFVACVIFAAASQQQFKNVEEYTGKEE